MNRSIIIATICLLLTACHWKTDLMFHKGKRLQTSESIKVKLSPGLLTSYYATSKLRCKTWFFVVQDLLEKDKRFTVVNNNHDILIEIYVEEQYLNMASYDKKGTLLFARTYGSDQFSDRQRGLAYTEGTTKKTEMLKKFLDELLILEGKK